MSRSDAVGSCRDILILRFPQHLVSETVAEESRRVEIDLAAKQFRKLRLDIRQTKRPHPCPGLENDKDVNCTNGTKALAKGGEEEPQPANSMTLAEGREFLPR